MCATPWLYRLASKRWHARWRLTPTPDGTLASIDDDAMARAGFVLAGPVLDLGVLEDEEHQELLDLLGRPSKDLEHREYNRQSDLLSRVPRLGCLPPLDIDINPASASYDPKKVPEQTWTAANSLSDTLEYLGLGRPVWYTSNDEGGLHGQLDPAQLEHPDLLRLIHPLLLEAAALLNIPTLAGQPSELAKRAPWYLDDSLFVRYPGSRGVLWRMPGTSKPGGATKQRANDEPGDPFTLSLERLLGTERDEHDPFQLPVPASGKTRQRASSREPRRRCAPEAMTSEDQALIARSQHLTDIWDQEPGDRSLRDALMVKAVLEATVSDEHPDGDENAAVRILYALPGGKAATERREPGYLAVTLKWARGAAAETIEHQHIANALAAMIDEPEGGLEALSQPARRRSVDQKKRAKRARPSASQVLLDAAANGDVTTLRTEVEITTTESCDIALCDDPLSMDEMPRVASLAAQLEAQHVARPRYCPNSRNVLAYARDNKRRFVMMRVPCKRTDCLTCGHDRRQEWWSSLLTHWGEAAERPKYLYRLEVATEDWARMRQTLTRAGARYSRIAALGRYIVWTDLSLPGAIQVSCDKVPGQLWQDLKMIPVDRPGYPVSTSRAWGKISDASVPSDKWVIVGLSKLSFPAVRKVLQGISVAAFMSVGEDGVERLHWVVSCDEHADWITNKVIKTPEDWVRAG